MTNPAPYVLKKIREAKQKQLKQLNLSNFYRPGEEKLTEIPSEVFELKWLEVLKFTNNKLTTIPKAIAELQNLWYLDLNFNQLTIIPEAIAELKNLRHLDLCGNKLTTIPASIACLQNLTYLDLSSNQLVTIPKAIPSLKHLETLKLKSNKLITITEEIEFLKNIVFLEINGNKLTVLPEKIAYLKNLTYLDSSANELTAFPEEVACLQNIRHLNLSFNQLTTIPAGIASLKNLRYLDLGNNKLTTIPDFIYDLPLLDSLSFANTVRYYESANKNKIKEVSSNILKLKKLKKLRLDNNSIERPPIEIVEKGVEAIKEYFCQLEDEGVDYLYEAKLVIVGEGGAGKTTLAKKIEDSNYQLQEEDTTKGIEVIQWHFPFEKGQFRVNIWDFGGQEIYHATHQFFLTKRSLYALVADTRREDTDFYYWLNVVELLSDNSPLLIVKNEKQDRYREINDRQLRGQFTNLKEILATNLATNRGLLDVLREIKHFVMSLPHIGAQLPKTWVRVREALERDSRNHITLDEYLNICQQNGFTQLQDKLQLSGYLHDLGVCLHFQNDSLLKKTVILKPKWGTDAVYKVLDNERVIRSLGKFTQSDLANIWCEDEYFTMQDELLRLMINFKLCYEISVSQGTYIAPQLLSANQPRYDWDTSNNLILRYTYEFMPKGILTQFIVVMHQLIDEQRYVWKSGVILSKDQTKAEVIENYGKREIKIRVTGSHKRDLMTIVTHELDKIHATYKRLKFNKLIPCNCSVCKNQLEPHFYKFESLKKRIVNKQDTVECDISYERIDVLTLVDDVIGREKFIAQAQRKEENQRNIDIEISENTTNLRIQLGKKSMEKQPEQIETTKPNDQVRLPWAWRNGMFFLFLFVTVFFAIAIFAGALPLASLVVALIATVLIMVVVGVILLRYDDRFSEEPTVKLIEKVLEQLPLLGNLLKYLFRSGQ